MRLSVSFLTEALEIIPRTAALHVNASRSLLEIREMKQKNEFFLKEIFVSIKLLMP